MNLWFRVIRVFFTALFRPKVSIGEETSVRFRVWPTDLDALWHMNNGKYCSLMDLGRFDMMIRNKLGKVLQKNGWYPVLASETIRFKQSLTLGQQFELRTRALGWDDKSFYLYHTFMRKERVIAVAVVRARFLSRAGGTVDAIDIVNAVAPGYQSPPLPEYIADLQSVEKELGNVV
jgi:acyl-CoA thioesterase FadM